MSGPIILPASSSSAVAAGILRPLYRRALGAQFGPFIVATTTAVSTHAEARRHVISSQLADDEWARDRMQGRYAYVATGAEEGHQARVVRSGYYGQGGVLELSRRVGAALAEGVEVEIGAWPSDQYLDTKGLNQIVNEALTRCTIESLLALDGNGTRSYSLLDYEDYIDQEDRVDAAYDGWATATGDPAERVAYPVRVDTTNGARTLVTGYAYDSGTTFDVRVLRQGHTLINTSGTWTTSTVGLTDDAQAAAVPIPWVVAFGMVKLLQIQTEMVEHDETLSDATKARRLDLLMARRRQWARTANRIALTLFPQPTPPLRDSMVGIGAVGPPSALPVSTP